eukprot:g31023.t1
MLHRVLSTEQAGPNSAEHPGASTAAALHKMLASVTLSERELMGCFARSTPLEVMHEALKAGHEIQKGKFDVHDWFRTLSSAIDLMVNLDQALAAFICTSPDGIQKLVQPKLVPRDSTFCQKLALPAADTGKRLRLGVQDHDVLIRCLQICLHRRFQPALELYSQLEEAANLETWIRQLEEFRLQQFPQASGPGDAPPPSWCAAATVLPHGRLCVVGGGCYSYELINAQSNIKEVLWHQPNVRWVFWCGGYYGQAYNTAYALDIETWEWRALRNGSTNSPTPRYFVASFEHLGALYAWGGRSSQDKYCNDLPRLQHSAVNLGGNLVLIFGGYEASERRYLGHPHTAVLNARSLQWMQVDGGERLRIGVQVEVRGEDADVKVIGAVVDGPEKIPNSQHNGWHVKVGADVMLISESRLQVLPSRQRPRAPSQEEQLGRAVAASALDQDISAAAAAYNGVSRTLGPERLLWHGTSWDCVANIAQNGFNRAYGGRHGSKLGRGSYFAEDATFALRFCGRSQPRAIFLAGVLPGRFCRGAEGLVEPPALDAGTRYDSTVDDAANPKVFCVFRDFQAIPLYLAEVVLN